MKKQEQIAIVNLAISWLESLGVKKVMELEEAVGEIAPTAKLYLLRLALNDEITEKAEVVG